MSSETGKRRLLQSLADFVDGSDVFNEDARADLHGWINWMEKGQDSTQLLSYFFHFSSVFEFYIATISDRLSRAEETRDRARSMVRRQVANNQTKQPTEAQTAMECHSDKNWQEACNEVRKFELHLRVLKGMRGGMNPDMLGQLANNERVDKRQDLAH